MARQIIYNEVPGGYDEALGANAAAADVTVELLFGDAGRPSPAVAEGRGIALRVDPAALSDGRTRLQAVRGMVMELDAALRDGRFPMRGSLNVTGIGRAALLGSGLSQAAVDQTVALLLDGTAFSMTSLYSDGQPGAAEAAVKYALGRGDDVVVNAPEGWRHPGPDGTDVLDEAAFKTRLTGVVDMDLEYGRSYIRAEAPAAGPIASLARAVAYGGTAYEDRTPHLLAEEAVALMEDPAATRQAVAQEALRLLPELGAAADGKPAYLVRLDALMGLLGEMAVAQGRVKAADAALDAAAQGFEVGEAAAEDLAAIRRERDLALKQRGAAMRSFVTAARHSFAYDLSSGGEFTYSLSGMTFDEGARLGRIDISGMTVQQVLDTIVDRRDALGRTTPDAITYAGPDATPEAAAEALYEQGVLPLVSMWAAQHKGDVERLRILAAGAGGTFFVSDSTADPVRSSVRAWSEILNGRRSGYSQEENEKYFSRIPRYDVHPDLGPEAVDGYDVYTVGVAGRSEKDFWSLVPKDVDVIVDARRYPVSSPKFNNEEFPAMAGNYGMEYVKSKDLSGTMQITRNYYEKHYESLKRDPRIARIGYVKKMDKDGKVVKEDLVTVYDYGAWARDPAFGGLMRENVVSALDKGKKVCVVFGKGDIRDARVKLLGQWLERNTAYRIGHIDTPRRGAARIDSQETAVRRCITGGKRLQRLRGGNYIGVDFFSQPTSVALPGGVLKETSFVLPEGEELVGVQVKPADDPRIRLAEGQLRPNNYGTEIVFEKVEADPDLPAASRVSKGLQNIAAAARRSHFSVLFKGSSFDRQTRAFNNLALAHAIKVSMPSRKEDYYNMKLISRRANDITVSLTKDIARQYSHGELRDLSDIHLGVFGATLSYLQNKIPDDLEEMTEADKRYILSQGGTLDFSMDARTDIEPEDVRFFVGEVLKRVVAARKNLSSGEEHERLFNITRIVSNYDSGVGEAAGLAAQELGLIPHVPYVDPLVTLDNETPHGDEKEDVPMFLNRSKGFLRHEVTNDMLVQQAAEERLAEADVPGLPTRYVVALWEMGLSNEDLAAVVATAARDGVVVNSAAGLYALLERHREQDPDLPVPAMDEVEDALEKADYDIAMWNGEGITVLTPGSPSYPDTLSSFPEYRETVIELRAGTPAQEAGAQSAETHVLAMKEMGVTTDAMEYVLEHARGPIDRPMDLYSALAAARKRGVDIEVPLSRRAVNAAWRRAVEDGEALSAAAQNRAGIGVATTHGRSVVRTKPMLLWAKGDITLLNDASVTVSYDAAARGTSRDEYAAAENIVRRFAERLSEEDMPMVARIDSRTEPIGPLGMLAKDGRVVGVLNDGFPVGDDPRVAVEHLRGDEEALSDMLLSLRAVPKEALTAAMQSLDETGTVKADSLQGISGVSNRAAVLATLLSNKDRLMRAAKEFPEDDIRDSLRRLLDDTAVQRGILERAVSERGRDLMSDVVKKGGVLVSETPPGRKGDDASRSRADRIAAGIGRSLAFVTAAASSRPMGVLEMAAYAVGGVTVLAVRGAAAIAAAFRNENPDITVTGASDEDMGRVVDEAARSAEQAEEAVEAEAEEAKEAVAEEAGKRKEIAEESRHAARAKVRPLAPFRESRAYNRIKRSADRMMELAEKMFEAPAAKAAPVMLHSAAIDVMHLGSERYFEVPEDQPAIAEALRARYGEGVNIVDSVTARKLRNDFNTGSVNVDGAIVRRWDARGGTMMRHPEAFSGTVYYHEGRIYNLMEVPNGLMDLPTPGERRRAADAWKDFIARMEGLQKAFQEGCGVHTPGQLRLQNADHLYITRTSVEVRRGDEVRAKISFRDGRIVARNYGLAASDLQEYHETPDYPVLTKIPRSIDAASLAEFGNDIEETLYRRPRTEQLRDLEISSDRALAEDRDEKIRNGWLRPREDNFGIALNDVDWAIHEGVLPDELGMEPVEDHVRIYAIADRTIELDAKRMKDLARKAKALEAKAAAAEQGGAQADEAAARDLEARLDAISSERRNLALRINDMKDVRDAALTQWRLYRTNSGGAMGLCLDGMVIEMPSMRPNKERMAAAARKMREALGDDVPGFLREELSKWDVKPAPAEEKKEEAVTPVAGPKEAPAVQTDEERKEALARWLYKAEQDEAMKASPEYAEKVEEMRSLLSRMEKPVVETLPNGLRVSSAKGAAAVLDGEGNPVGETYSRITPTKNNAFPALVKAYRQNPVPAPGEAAPAEAFKLLGPDGKPVVDEWLVSLKNPLGGHLALLREDGGYRIWDPATKKCINDEVYANMFAFKDGWWMVMSRHNSWNFVNGKGELLSPGMWFDRVCQFSEDGVAYASVGRECFRLSNDGAMSPIRVASERKKAEMSFSHKK